MEAKRLNKFISDSGYCSRRDADKLIEQGRVTVNNKLAEAGTKVTAKDKVRIDEELLQVKEEALVYLLFNKPVGISSSTNRSVKNNIISALNYPASLQPIGLLDREAEGLMFLSNDPDFVIRMNKADNKFEKEYLVTVDKHVSPDFLSKVSEGGIPVPGTPKKQNFVTKEGPNRFRIILEPGTNHHVKRICEELGYKVMHLQRVRIHDIKISKLAVRFWRVMTATEIQSLKSILGGKNSQGKTTGTTHRNDFQDDFYSNEEPVKFKSAVTKPARTSGAPKGGQRQNRTGMPKPDAKNTTSRRPSSSTGRSGGADKTARTNTGPKRGTRKTR